MMMKMLDVGGLEIVTDNVRKADADNPKGYYEFEKVKTLHQETNKAWLGETKGKAVKIVSELLEELPETHLYKVIFMNRDLQEVVESQNKMLLRRGNETESTDDEKMRALFENHLEKVKSWLDRQSHLEVVYVNYIDVLNDSAAEVRRIEKFLDTQLNVEKMVNVIDPQLYRNRR